MSTKPESVRCLVINLWGIDLLIPSAVVAEITNMADPEVTQGAPEWMAGMFAWRNVSVPLLDLEQLSGVGESQAGSDAKVVVLYGLQGKPEMQFYALMVQGVPKAVKVSPEIFEGQKEDSENDFFMGSVVLDDKKVMVPDFPALEAYIADQITMAKSA